MFEISIRRLSLAAAISFIAMSAAAQDAPTSQTEPAPAPAEAFTTPDAAPSAEAALAPDATPGAEGGLVGAPPAGKGQVVFFRPPKFTGAAISFKVREGTQELGTLGFGRYFVVTAEPGAHIYAVRSEAKDELRLEVEPGETYYVSAAITMGLAVGRPNLSPSDKAAFDSASGKLKLAGR